MTSVVFAMEWVPQYRAPFYDGLRQRLASEGIEVRLLHGDPPASRVKRGDQQTLPWAEMIPNRFWTVSGLEVTWQPVLGRLRRADLIVLQQETGLLLNYPALVRARLGGTPVALWGHGQNFNPLDANPRAEWVKSKVTRLADWFFAYTERSATVFRSIGAPDDRITVVRNSMDIASLTDPSGTPSAEIEALVAGLRERKARVGWIVSALDTWKRVPMLLDVVDTVREQVPSFEFVVVGAGADAGVLDLAARSRPWLHVVGPRFGPDKAALGRVAELTIHPGLAGLHVIDAFATATPMVTADIEYHSHEIDYLDAGSNAVVLPGAATVADFAAAVTGLLADDDELARLQEGCRKAAEIFTLDAMVERFAAGIVAALERTS
ncbi:MAG: glycosyltransferase family 4 protein [Acidimicrobiia bacterium]|nr:glycosyltransferase family 4 protein [Acidimicrobiia bacterium]